MSEIRPSARQIEYQDWELGVFLHFGIRTFFEGHKDWDGKAMDPAEFNPSELDCEQWAETAVTAGAKYMVLTAKHHDGFANWPSKYTDFSVAHSKWQSGSGDVIREYTNACRKFGLKVGLYYSPADASCPVYKDDKAYDDYFINQISELLCGEYGEIDMLWFDGCGSEGHEYDWKRITGEIRKMQPNILIFNMGDPDYRWVGNEAGLAPCPNWNIVESVDFSVMTADKEKLSSGKSWLSAECDFMMRDKNWFFSSNDVHTVKSVDELLGNYYYTVGRGANMLINIGPDRRGLLPEPDSKSLIGMGDEVKRLFSKPLAGLNDFTQEDQTWTHKCPNYESKSNEIVGTISIDHVVIGENLTYGENIKRFRISIKPYSYGNPITVYEGYNVGHKAICQFPLVRCQEVYFEVLESDEKVELAELAVFDSRK